MDKTLHQRVNAAAAQKPRAGRRRLLFRPGRRHRIRVDVEPNFPTGIDNRVGIADQERFDEPARLGVAHRFEHRHLLGADNPDAQGRRVFHQREQIIEGFQHPCH